MLESDVQTLILNWLVAKRIFHYRNNSGAFKIKDRFVRFGAVGSPDIIAVIDGQYVGIECKAPKGKQSESQKAFQKNLEDAGGKYVLAYSLEDFTNNI